MANFIEGWQSRLGARVTEAGVHFRVWSMRAHQMEVEIEPPWGGRWFVPMQPEPDHYFTAHVPGIGSGTRYRYRIDGGGLFPDPASRYQPAGVHGPSEIVDAMTFSWGDLQWKGLPLNEIVLYELHIGVFTPSGTYAGAINRLPYLLDLGINAIELMPLADFAGQRNWGYDGVSPFAPARCYGRPDDLRRFIDAAHGLGLAVVHDVVYNHLGPDGNYLGQFSGEYFSRSHRTPWGAALNFDGPHSRAVRDYFIENALYWLHEYHFDGLRLDATQAISDHSPKHFLAELSDRVKASANGRHLFLIAEDLRNLNPMLQPTSVGGWGMDGVWNDDFHHQFRRYLTGDHEGYYQDYSGTLRDLATTINDGWLYRGEHSKYLGHARGTDPGPVQPHQLIIYLQNHDQTGNRALGDRLHHQLDTANFRAASVLLLCCPQTPLLFMGQEWAASAPFQFFTDHHEGLGRLIRDGRRRDYHHFSAFSDPVARERIPDPQALSTFLNSRIDWEERLREPHASISRLYHKLLGLRRSHPALHSRHKQATQVTTTDNNILMLRREGQNGEVLWVLACFHRGGVVEIPAGGTVILITEDSQFCTDPQTIRRETSGKLDRWHFQRPGAVLVEGYRE